MNLTNIFSSPAGRRWHDVAYWGLMLVACIVFYWMNVLTPLKEDDMGFTLVGGSPYDIWMAQVDHFMTANARFADIVATVFCGFMGKPVFNVLNTLVFALMVHLLSVLSVHRRSVTVVAMFLAFLGCFYPVPGQTMLFAAGSCNYLWSITASLLLVMYLLKEHNKPFTWVKGILLFIAGFIAGNFNEAASFGFFPGFVLYYIFNRSRLDRRAVVVLSGYLLGILFIVASPGAWIRAAQGDIVVNMSPGDLIVSRWQIFYDKMWRFYTPIAATIIGVVVLLWKGRRPILRYIWAHLFVGLMVVMYALGILNERAYAPLVTVAFIIVAMGVDYVLKQWRWMQWIRPAIIVGCLAVTVYADMHAIEVIKRYQAYDRQMVSEITNAPSQAVLRESSFPGYSRFVMPLRYVSSGFFVREDIYCNYFNKKNVQFVSDSVYERFHSGRLLDGAVPEPVSSNRPDIADSILTLPGQEYAVAPLHLDKLPFTSQQGRYYMLPDNDTTSTDVKVFRYQYGLEFDYKPVGVYPLYYGGRLLMVLPFMDDSVHSVVFPIDHLVHPTEITLTRIR